jgi:hypothetical protein
MKICLLTYFRPEEAGGDVRTTFTITLDQVAEKAVKQAPQIAAKKLAIKTAMDDAVRSSQKQTDEQVQESPSGTKVFSLRLSFI